MRDTLKNLIVAGVVISGIKLYGDIKYVEGYRKGNEKLLKLLDIQYEITKRLKNKVDEMES